MSFRAVSIRPLLIGNPPGVVPWRRIGLVPNPTATIAFAENASGADHIMPNYWVSARDAVDVASQRHLQRSNYNFVDGHAESREFLTVYSPSNHVDQWHPLMAR